MSKFSIRAVELCDSALASTRPWPDSKLHQIAQQCRQRLNAPMSVAVVGKIKAGKSTVVNAMLGEALLPTGAVECTFNVNWLVHGPKRELLVHWKSRETPESFPFEALRSLTERSAENRDRQLDVRYAEVRLPNPLLREFSLIDTPGLESFYEDDSANTREFLKIHGRALSESTFQNARVADAMLFLFKYNVGQNDEEVLSQFQGVAAGRATPFNSIGVLSQVDAYWPAHPDPLQIARSVIDEMWSRHPQLRQVLYAMVPICGLLGLGAQTLADSDLESIKALAKCPFEAVFSLLKNARRFVNTTDELVHVTPLQRAALADKLGRFGVFKAVTLFQAGVTSRIALSQALLDASGLTALRRMLSSHFGNRAVILKMGLALAEIQHACFNATQCATSSTLTDTCRGIAADCEKFALTMHEFSELSVLRQYYEGEINFAPSDAIQLLQILGEMGASDLERLGLESHATTQEAIARADERARYWQARGNEPLATQQRATIRCAKVLAQSYLHMRTKLLLNRLARFSNI